MTREEAIEILKAISVYECYPKSASEETKEALDMAIEALNDRPQGEWIDSKTAKRYVVCSNCNKLTASINRKKYNYCPFCGADVRSGVM